MLRSVIPLFSMLGLSILAIPTELALASDNPNVKSIARGDSGHGESP
ncbi:hypothetical protein G9X68_09590 [Rhizobium sp. WYCCWR 11279]|nr:hypothetical protein [Rhizobium changzhiense]NNU47369.1 hypothetical protein [Rhizobium changzhiense]